MTPNPISRSLPIDPDLPDSFDCTPNDERSTKELDQWWDQPYLITNGDGTYTARCLNGGAWDRSMFLGTGVTVEEATIAGLAAHERFIAFRSKPTALYVDGLTWDLIVMPQRPDADQTVIARGLSPEEVTARIGK